MAASLRRNSFYGFLAYFIPSAVLLITYPILVRGLGGEAFGIYLLAVTLGGALSVLNLGLAPATTHYLAHDLARNRREEAGQVISTSLFFYAVIGSTLALLLYMLAPLLPSLFSVEGTLTRDTVISFRLASIQLALFFLISVLLSVFKGFYEFSWSALTLSVLAVLSHGGAAFVVFLGYSDLPTVLRATLLAHLVVFIAAFVFMLKVCRRNGDIKALQRPSLTTFRRLLGFGLFMTANSLAGFLLYQIQRYLLAAFIGPGAVTIFHLSMLIPKQAHATMDAFTEIMFPYASSTRNPSQLRRLFVRMLLASFIFAASLLGALVIFRKPLLSFWLGAAMAQEVARYIPEFALAFFFLALSPAPYHLINGIGRPGLNTLFYTTNGIANLLFIAAFLADGLELQEFVWAFLLSNVLTSIAYQLTVECVVWRGLGAQSPGLLSSKEIL